MSSISPIETKSSGRRIADWRGAFHRDAPASGGEVGAEAASLTIMVRGPAETFGTVHPLLARTITLVGDSGAGQTAKIAGQIIVALTIEAVGEALMGGFAASRVLEVRGDRMIRRSVEPEFWIALHQKDLDLASKGARSLGVGLPNTASCQQLFNVATAAGGAGWDHSELARVLEDLAGHEIGA